jgi:phosphocarrier protein HPr
MTLVAAMGTTIRVECEGPDAEACLQALDKLATDRFGEKE